MNRHKHLCALTMLLLLAVLLATAVQCAPAPAPTPTPPPVEKPTEKPPEKPAPTLAPKVLRFGSAIEMTGPKSTEGGLQKDGMEFWKDYVNSQGGIDIGGEKYLVDIIYYDDESDAKTAAKLTEKLITEDGTKFLFGPFSSALTIATCAIGEKYGAITVAPLANSGQIYNQGYRYVFSVLPPAANYLRLLIEMGVTDLDPTPQTVAILALDDPFGISCAEGTKKWAEEYGLEVVMYEKYPSDTKDVSSLLTKVKGLNPDLVLGSSLYEHAVLITRQAKELNLCPKLMGFTVGPTFPAFIESLGKDAEYIYGSEWWLPNMGWKGPVFGDSYKYAEMFEEKYGYIPDYHAAAGTAAGVLYQLALEKAGTTDVEKVRDALASLDVEFFWGPHAFNEKGENIKGGSGPIQVQDGKHVCVYPSSIRQAPPRYPMPCWDER